MKHLAILLGLMLLMPGCVRSLHPFYTEAQLVFDPSLNGTWSDSDKKNTLAITGDAEHKLYDVLYTDVEKNKTGRFEVHLAKVQDLLIADIAPADPKLDDSEVYLAHLIPVHSFMLVTYDAHSMQVKTMSYDWFKSYLHDHPDAIKHEVLEGNDDNIILTAPTDQLQAFILKNVNTQGAFGDATSFQKISATTQP